MKAAHPELERLGDSALLLRWPGIASEATSAAVSGVVQRLNAARPPWLIDVVPAYCSVALLVDVDHELDTDPLARAERWITAALANMRGATESPSPRSVELPVCYDLEFGLDLPALADATGLTVARIIALHAAPDYRVAMLGFAPGFPYLLGLDPRLGMPRLASPRARVAAGSIAIGGSQTGVYPGAGPGGWRLIGRTPLTLFDAPRDPPSLLQPGDEVRFVPIERADFDARAFAP